MLRITHVCMSPFGTTHEHIQQVWIIDETLPGSGRWWLVDEVVLHLKAGKGPIYVDEGGRRVEVQPRKSLDARWFIQTVTDGYWQNNLLARPRMVARVA